MAFELKVPTVGESITEVQIGEWRKREGDWADKNEPLVEIETDKATVEIPAPVAGIVSKVLKQQGDRAVIGDVIGYFEERAKAAATPASPPPAKDRPAPNVPVAPPSQASSPRGGETRVMPAAERAMATHGLRAQDATPTGPGGRLLKEDVERAAAERIERPVEHPVAVRESIALAPAGTKSSPPVSTTGPDGRPARSEKIVPMSLIRRRIAERLVEAQQNAALLTTFNEIDMSAVVALRTEYKESFQKRYGAKLGFMSFFVKATVDALQSFPAINAEIRGDDVVYHNYYDIGIAVGGGKGLVVPVLRDADRLSFAQIEMAIADFGRRAGENKLELHELQGGTFTISNGGVYGSLLSTPIVNPPQSGILGLHGINDRPIAHAGQVVIRPMMYIALTYDHRLVDGREAVTFLRRVKELIEDPTRLLLEV